MAFTEDAGVIAWPPPPAEEAPDVWAEALSIAQDEDLTRDVGTGKQVTLDVGNDDEHVAIGTGKQGGLTLEVGEHDDERVAVVTPSRSQSFCDDQNGDDGGAVEEPPPVEKAPFCDEKEDEPVTPPPAALKKLLLRGDRTPPRPSPRKNVRRNAKKNRKKMTLLRPAVLTPPPPLQKKAIESRVAKELFPAEHRAGTQAGVEKATQTADDVFYYDARSIDAEEEKKLADEDAETKHTFEDALREHEKQRVAAIIARRKAKFQKPSRPPQTREEWEQRTEEEERDRLSPEDEQKLYEELDLKTPSVLSLLYFPAIFLLNAWMLSRRLNL